MKPFINLIICLLLSGSLAAQCAASYLGQSNKIVYNEALMDRLISPQQHKAIFYGETHNVHFEPAWKFKLIKHLHARYGIKDVFMEVGIAAAHLFNEYLSTGDTSLIQGLVYTDHHYQDFWQDLFMYNMTVPVEERVVIHGVDFERTEVLKVLAVTGPVPASLQNVFNRMAAADTLNAFDPEFEQLLCLIQSEFSAKQEDVKKLYGERYPLVSRIILNDCPITQRAVPRNKVMYRHLMEVLKDTSIHAFVGFFGQAHTTYNVASSLPNSLKKEARFKGKVLTFNTVYKDAFSPQGLIPYTGMLRAEALEEIYNKYMDTTCRATVIPSHQIENRRLRKSADLILFAKDYIKPVENNWKELTSLKIYRFVSIDKIDSISNEEISRMPFREADLEAAKKIMPLATVEKGITLWKGGGTLAIATFADGSSVKLMISNYGGFFHDSKSRNTYIFKETDRAAWDGLIAGPDQL